MGVELFPVWGYLDKGAMNINVHVLGLICVFIYLGVELLSHVVNVKLFSKVVISFNFPTGNEGDLQVFPILINSLFNFSYCN